MMRMMLDDRVIQVAAAKALGSVVAYLGLMVALMYPVAKAAGYLA